MGRTPARRRRSAIHTGVGALAFTPSITRPTKRGTFSPASSSTTRSALPCAGTGAASSGWTWLPGDRGHVVGNAANAEAIRAVGRELDLDAGVGETQVFADGRTDGRVVRQFQQAGSIGVDAEFLGRAEHAVRLHATQLGRLDGDTADVGADHGQRSDQPRTRVRRAAHDLQERPLPGIDLADLQAIRFRMPGAFDDARHHDAGQAVAQRRHFLDLQPDRGQHRRQFVAGGLGGNMAAQPVFAEFHRVTVGWAAAHHCHLSIVVGDHPSIAVPFFCVAGPKPVTQTGAGTARRSRRTRAGR